MVGIRRMKYPLRSQLGDISRVDLAEAAVTAPRVVAVVGKPVPGGGLNKKISRLHIHAHRYDVVAATAHRNDAESEDSDRGRAQKALVCLAWKPNTPTIVSLIHLSFSM